MNAYVDNAIGMIHENISNILQLKTQLRVSNEIIAEKDSVISSLNSQLENNKTNIEETNLLRERVASLEQTNNSLVNQNSHLNTALNQIATMKKEIREKDSLIAELQLKLSSPRKKINIKSKLEPSSENDF
jgi:predicted RNase H-like nuclease (RuvC/YqgF family)